MSEKKCYHEYTPGQCECYICGSLWCLDDDGHLCSFTDMCKKLFWYKLLRSA